MNGKDFKEMRGLLGLKQQDVADFVGINQGYVSAFENDNCTQPEALRAIAKFIAAVRYAVDRELEQRPIGS